MQLDPETCSLTEIIRVQDQLSEVLRRRFARRIALCFTDIVGSTAYFARHGDEAGRRLQQRHFDRLDDAVRGAGGRVVDRVGDGAFSCFPRVEAAVGALEAFFARTRDDNAARAKGDELLVRASLHWGEVLTDGEIVTGDAVNLAARVGQTGDAAEVRITRQALRELPTPMRLRCRRIGPLVLKGIERAVEAYTLALRGPPLPILVRISETGQELALPADQETISFGRLAELDGERGNDVVLAAEGEDAQSIGRFHFELLRRADDFLLRALSTGITEVDGVIVPRGGEAVVRAGTVVKVSRLLTLTFVGPKEDDTTLSTLEPY